MSDDAQNSIADLGGEMASATAMPASTAAVAIDGTTTATNPKSDPNPNPSPNPSDPPR